MRIALVILHADPGRGGAERYTVDLAAGLVGRGHSVSLLASNFGDDIPLGVSAVALAASGRTRVGRYRAFLDSLDSVAASTRFDVVHAMLPVRACDVYHPHAGMAAEAVASGPTLSRWGNLLNRRRHLMATVEGELLRGPRPPVVLCLSNYVKASVRRWYPNLGEDRLVRLFNGVDLDRFDPARRADAGVEVRRRLGIGEDAVVALMLANDFVRKGLETAIAAVAAVGDKRLVLVVAGRPDPAAYRRLAESLGVAERIYFAGQTNDSYAFYRAADFFVLPTRHDPCSLVVLEALAMGVPVISTAFNGACEVMTEGREGVVLGDPGDVGALAAAMTGMLDGRARQERAQAALGLRPIISQNAHLDILERIYAGARRQD